MVQLLPSASLTKLLPSSLIVPLTLVDFGAVEGLCFVGSLLDCAGSCARAISGSARKMESVALHNFAGQPVAFAGNHVEVVIGKLSPLPADRPFQLHPLTFHLFPVHLYGLLYMMKTLRRERTLPSETSRHREHEQDH